MADQEARGTGRRDAEESAQEQLAEAEAELAVWYRKAAEAEGGGE
jgi:hypothetical protein